jgi:amino acid adenylation domain-containing protein
MTTMQESASTDKRQRLLELLMQPQSSARPAERITPRRSRLPPQLSFAQQRLWFLDKLVPGSPFYNLPAAIRIEAGLDLGALHWTLNEITRRHEVLRTSFPEVANQPVQVVAPTLEIPIPCTDLRHLDHARREAEVVRLATEDAQKPFDLSRGPLIRASVLWLGATEYVFLINLHHIIADGWSMGVLVQEFQQHYAAYVEGRLSPQPSLEIQYGDFADWQHQRVADGKLQPQLNYWIGKLANLPTIDLPTDFPRRTIQGFEGETLIVTLPLDISDGLKAFSQRERVTLFMTLLAGFNALVHRYTGADEVVIGEPVANRNRLELEPLIGFFVNSLVLRTDVSGDPTFHELLRRSRNVVLEADANQDVPFELLVERLRPERTMGRNPLFQLSLQFFSGAEVKGGAVLPAEVVHVEKGTASLDLAFDLMDSAQGIVIRAEYSTELFRRDTVERMVMHYRTLLDAFVRNPELRISQAPMLTPTELARLMDGNRMPPPEPFVHVVEMVREQTRRTPDAFAIECDERRLTYNELGARASALAGRLRARGIEPETIVAMVFDRSIEIIVGILAIWEAGGAYLPLDPQLPDERIRLLLDSASPRLVLAAPAYAERAATWGLPTLGCEESDSVAAEPLAPPGGAENLAYVIYTSGSSGVPKAVMIEHGALSRHLAWMQAEFPLAAGDSTVFKYAVSFDVSILEMIYPLTMGARIVVFGGSGHFDVAALAAMMREQRVTTLDAVPAMIAALLEQPDFFENSALRRVISGGDVMSPDLLDRLLDRPGLEVVNMYGPTEATISATFWRARQVGTSDRLPIGRPAGPYTAHVLDAYLNPMPIGAPGELWLGGRCLARGYLGQPELTEQRFVRDPFSPDASARLYRTGDRCRMRADGMLEFLGRADNQVKLRGHRIELGEIEATLAASSLVRSCAVALRQDRGQPELVGYVVPTAGEPEFWPSVGEYFIYDELLYHVMTADRVRMRAYKSAIERVVRGKTVLDIGTGADMALARLCLEAGARHVYAIEMLDEACRRAEKLAEAAGISDRVTLLHGDSRQLPLPEKVDVCVSELIGTIGSSEGVIDVLNDARRFLKRQGTMIPYRCVTKIAAVSLPDYLLRQPGFGEIAAHYVERIFTDAGRRFDIRLCAKNLPANCIISDAAEFEVLAFERHIPREESREIELKLHSNGRLDGLLLWINLYPGPEDLIDVLTSECSWLPVFMPIISPSMMLQAGDTIRATCSRLAEPGQFTPDYLLRGVICSRKAGDRPFTYESRRDETACGATPLYRDLFDSARKPAARAATDHPQRERVGEWRRVYDELYDADGAARDAGFDIVGWNSSYTGLPLSADEMGEQVAGTVARIAALGGRRVLEIGCGTGLLLLRLAEKTERYVGTDFSAVALEGLGAAVRARGLSHVELWERTADDFSGIAEGSFDVVVLNSVVQYFPDVDYLVRVLREAMRIVGPSGAVFVGDVRSLPLLPALHAEIEMLRAEEGATAAEVRERIAARGEQEQELVLDPEFFPTLCAQLENGGGVEIQLKQGWRHNELTRYRFDAVLYGARAMVRAPVARELTWQEIGDLAALRRRLARATEPLLIRGVPNARLVGPCRLVAGLQQADAGAPATSAQRDVDVGNGGAGAVEPEQLWQLGQESGWDIRIGFADQNAGACDLLCLRPVPGARRMVRSAAAPAQQRPLRAYANTPTGKRTRQQLAEALRRHLRSRLPGYMIPASFVWLDALPLTPHGKVNHRALPAPDRDQSKDAARFAPSETPLHEQIVETWKGVLGRDGFGIDANFFNIGGHSLMATQVVSRLADILDIDIPLRLMFELPTIRDFAEGVERLRQDVNARPIPPVMPGPPPVISPVNLEGLNDEEVERLLNRLLTTSDT